MVLYFTDSWSLHSSSDRASQLHFSNLLLLLPRSAACHIWLRGGRLAAMFQNVLHISPAETFFIGYLAIFTMLGCFELLQQGFVLDTFFMLSIAIDPQVASYAAFRHHNHSSTVIFTNTISILINYVLLCFMLITIATVTTLIS